MTSSCLPCTSPDASCDGGGVTDVPSVVATRHFLPLGTGVMSTVSEARCQGATTGTRVASSAGDQEQQDNGGRQPCRHRDHRPCCPLDLAHGQSPISSHSPCPMIVRKGDDTARALARRRVSTETPCFPQGVTPTPAVPSGACPGPPWLCHPLAQPREGHRVPVIDRGVRPREDLVADHV